MPFSLGLSQEQRQHFQLYPTRPGYEEVAARMGLTVEFADSPRILNSDRLGETSGLTIAGAFRSAFSILNSDRLGETFSSGSERGL